MAHHLTAMVRFVSIREHLLYEPLECLRSGCRNRRTAHVRRSNPLALTDKTRKGSAHAPKHVEFVDSLPVTSLGKVDKKALRAKFWAGQNRMVG
jgi:acyl-CoA synthetase (AMP-forming)/AMP-acid ligase II